MTKENNASTLLDISMRRDNNCVFLLELCKVQKHQSVLRVLGDLGDSQASLDRASCPESLAPEQLLLEPRKKKWVKKTRS